jgi:O-Antigen ligase
MRKFLKVQRRFTSIEISVLLCFLLPPAGILFLFLIGLHTFYKQWFVKQWFVFSLSSYFFLCLFISSIGASILMKEITYLSISVMILGYWGLYVKILESEKNRLFQRFRFIMIFGGIYSCLIGWVSKWITFPTALSYLTGTVLFGKVEPKNYSRLIGCEYNPNFTVYILLLSISFLFALLLTSIKTKQFIGLIWQIPFLLLLSYGVVETGSRAGFATMIVIYFLFFFRLNRFFFIISTIIGVFLLKWLFHLIPRVDSVIQASQTRFDIWKGSFTIWQEHSLFGVTPLGFGQEYLKHYNEFVPHAHNILIGMFAEYGTLGGLAFLLLVSLNLVKCVHLFFSIRRKKYFLDSFLLGLPIILLTGVFDEPLFSPQIGFLTVVFLACWDQYSKRILFVIKLPSISRINEWIYTQILEPKDQP